MAQKQGFWRKLGMRGGAALLLLPMAACAHYDYAPGPGMSAMNLSPDMARCRIFARGATPDVGFEASGSPRFVVAAAATALAVSAIGGAIQQNQNYNDCMQARGWRVMDPKQPVAVAAQQLPPLAGAATMAPMAMGAMAPVPVNTLTSPVVTTAGAPLVMAAARMPLPRRSLGLNVLPMTGPLASATSLPTAEGLFVVDVMGDGVAASAGLQRNDVVLAFGAQPVNSVGDLQAALTGVAHGNAVALTIWRDGRPEVASLRF